MVSKRIILITLITLFPITKTFCETKNNCDNVIKGLKKQHPEAETYGDLFPEQRRIFDNCVQLHGFENSKTSTALQFRPELKSMSDQSDQDNDSAIGAAYIEKKFSYDDLQVELPQTLGSLVAATEVELPTIGDLSIAEFYLRTTIAQHENEIRDMSESEAKDLKEKLEDELVDRIRKSIEPRRNQSDQSDYLGKVLSNADLVCKELGFQKAKTSRMSRNIIPAFTERGKKLMQIDDSFALFGKNPIHYTQISPDKDDEKNIGYRFYESITCAKINITASDDEKERFDKVEHDTYVANWKLQSALVYKTDPNYHDSENTENHEEIENAGRKKTKSSRPKNKTANNWGELSELQSLSADR